MSWVIRRQCPTDQSDERVARFAMKASEVGRLIQSFKADFGITFLRYSLHRAIGLTCEVYLGYHDQLITEALEIDAAVNATGADDIS